MKVKEFMSCRLSVVSIYRAEIGISPKVLLFLIDSKNRTIQRIANQSGSAKGGIIRLAKL